MWQVGQKLFNAKTESFATVQSIEEVYEGCFEVTIVCPLGSTASGLQEQHEQCGWSAVGLQMCSTCGWADGCDTCDYRVF